MKETIYEHYFSSPEKMAEYIDENCCLDCYVCAFRSIFDDSNKIPCYFKFNVAQKDALINWLNSEYKEY